MPPWHRCLPEVKDRLHPLLRAANLRWLDDSDCGYGHIVAGGYANALLHPHLVFTGDMDLFWVDKDVAKQQLEVRKARAEAEQRAAAAAIADAAQVLHKDCHVYVNITPGAYPVQVTTITVLRWEGVACVLTHLLRTLPICLVRCVHCCVH